VKRSLFTTAIIALISAASLAAGEGFLTKWPESGTWVKYAVTQEMTRRGVPDKPQAGEPTVRFLEADAEDGAPCRWLELDLELAYSNGESRNRETIKYLLPLKALNGSGDPGLAVLRGWVRDRPEGDVKRIEQIPDFLDAWQLTPPLKDRKLSEAPREIDYQRGKLSVTHKVEGETEWRKLNHVVRVHHEHWLHTDVPNGLAAARLETRMSYPDEVRYVIITNYALTDFGTGASSALANHR
jgi:hypothetical protein